MEKLTKKKYEYDIKEKSLEFSIQLLKFLRGLDKSVVFYSIIDQITRSGTSIGANIHEAQSSNSEKEMIRYYRTALKSAKETEYWFKIIDSLVKAKEESDKLQKELTNLHNILVSVIVRLKEKEIASKN